MESKKNQLRIGIDARFYGPRQKGLGRYVQKLIEDLEEIDSKNQYLVFLRKENYADYRPKNSNFKKVLADYKWYGLSEQIFFPFKIWQSRVDLIHFPHFNVPLICSAPFVVTIHDLILKKFAPRRASLLGPVRYWLKNLGYSLVIRLALKRAGKIIAVSNYTKEDVLKYFKAGPEKIEVIYEGAPEIKLKVRGPKRKIAILASPAGRQNSKLFEKYNISKPYLLYVGNAYPHKNLERLILAFNQLNQDGNLQLVLVGELDYFYRRLQKRFSDRERVVFADFVSDSDLAALYQNAVLYVFPSLCEGFGLPPLEAMAYGLPVVCSDSSCLPEVLGEAAKYFNPESVDDMVGKISSVLGNKNLQERLVSNGFERIKKYSWRQMAEKTLKTYLDL